MSAFIVEKQTIDRIINSILARRTELTYAEGIPNIPFDNQEELTAFGQKLWNMNIDAVNQRYDESNDIPTYAFARIKVSHIQALKSLRCFLYQCSEGDVPATKLYKELDKLSLELAYMITTESQAYDNAEWG